MMTPAHFGWSDKIAGLPYDPDKAKGGFDCQRRQAGLSITIGAFFDQRVAEAILQELREVGSTSKSRRSTRPTFLQLIQKGPADAPALAISTNSCACQDADGVLDYLFHSGSTWTIVAKPEIDALLDEAGSSSDEQKRLADYEKIGQFIVDQVAHRAALSDGRDLWCSQGAEFSADFLNESFFLNRMSWAG